MAANRKDILRDYECEGQMSIFEIADKPLKFHEREWLEGHGYKNIYYEKPPRPGIYEFADIENPTKTKKLEVAKNGSVELGHLAMGSFRAVWWRPIKETEQNRSEDLEEIIDDYIREHPTCFYVFGHYLDKVDGWHKVPEELPTFKDWTLVDVVVYGKKTGTPWMEHEKWEAKDWAFRSIDDRGNTESITVLAWRLSDK